VSRRFVVSALLAIGVVVTSREALAPRLPRADATADYFALAALLESSGPQALADASAAAIPRSQRPPAVPEPGPALLAAVGLALLAAWRVACSRPERHPRTIMDRAEPPETRCG
jgi:MYXO-CTERM domain-containing protein